MKKMKKVTVDSISDYIKEVLVFRYKKHSETLYFRGEPMDFNDTALQPSIYRGNIIKNEHELYRDIQRFNDSE